VGTVDNNESAHVTESQVQANSADDLGAKAVSKELGGLPIFTSKTVPVGSVRVVLANDYTGPGSGLGGGDETTALGYQTDADDDEEDTTSPPSPIITAGSSDPQCVN
jgi:hypothetical protein